MKFNQASHNGDILPKSSISECIKVISINAKYSLCRLYLQVLTSNKQVQKMLCVWSPSLQFHMYQIIETISTFCLDIMISASSVDHVNAC